jgi:hypothetical protein
MTAIVEREMRQGWLPHVPPRAHRVDAGAATAYVGPSAFDIPEKIEILIVDGRLTMTCEYSDEERESGPAVEIPGHLGVSAYLGKYTRKVLRIESSDALTFLEKDNAKLNAQGIASIAARLPNRQAKVLIRNAAVLNDVMDTMPAELRKAVIRVARNGQQARQK